MSASAAAVVTTAATAGGIPPAVASAPPTVFHVHNTVEINSLVIGALSSDPTSLETPEDSLYSVAKKRVKRLSMPLLIKELDQSVNVQGVCASLEVVPPELSEIITDYVSSFFPSIQTNLCPLLRKHLIGHVRVQNPSQNLDFPAEVPSLSIMALEKRGFRRILLFGDSQAQRTYHVFWQRFSFPLCVHHDFASFPQTVGKVGSLNIILQTEHTGSEGDVEEDEIDPAIDDSLGRSIDALIVPEENNRYLMNETFHLHLSLNPLKLLPRETVMQAVARQQVAKQAVMAEHLNRCVELRAKRAANFKDNSVGAASASSVGANSTNSSVAAAHSRKRKRDPFSD